MLLLIIKIIDLLEGLLDFFIYAQLDITKADDGQWVVDVISTPTAKGWAVLADVATIVHYGLDFVAQFTALLPLAEGTWNSSYGASTAALPPWY